MTPDPPYLEGTDEEDQHTRPRSRMGNFLSNAFKPSSPRTAREFTTNSLSGAMSGGRATDVPPPPSIGLSPARVDHIIPSTCQYSILALHSPCSIAADFKNSDSRPARRVVATFPPPPTAPLPAEQHRRSTLESPLSADRPQLSTQSIWRFLPAFLSPTHNQTNTLPDVTPVPLVPIPLKGDVECLSYNTLDDKGMRRLEGRSDHRPVMGAYVVYI